MPSGGRTDDYAVVELPISRQRVVPLDCIRFMRCTTQKPKTQNQRAPRVNRNRMGHHPSHTVTVPTRSVRRNERLLAARYSLGQQKKRKKRKS